MSKTGWFLLESTIPREIKVSEEKTITLDQGWGNGYVCIDPQNPLNNLDYSELDKKLDVHGGITLCTVITESMVKNSGRIPEQFVGMKVIGFDTAHAHDTLEKWPKEKVEEETINLYNQVLQYEEQL